MILKDPYTLNDMNNKFPTYNIVIIYENDIAVFKYFQAIHQTSVIPKDMFRVLMCVLMPKLQVVTSK